MRLSEITSLRHLLLEGDFSGRTEAYYTRASTPHMSSTDIDRVQEYLDSERLATVRICLHQNWAAPVHEMIIFHKKGGDFQIHKHLDKSESYQIIRGRLAIETFDDNGNALDQISLDASESGSGFICKIPQELWHRTLPMTNCVVFKETRPGPFEKNDSVVAPSGFGGT